MAHQSFAKTVLDTLRQEVLAGDGEVSARDLSIALHLMTRKDNKRMLSAIYDHMRSGKVKRVRTGVYTVTNTDQEPDKREVMWRTLRMRKVVTIADLQELAGVSHVYAKEWLEMLVKRGIAMRITPPNKNTPHSWRLIKHDLAEIPVDTEKAKKLRDLRSRKKKQLLTRIDTIGSELAAVRDTIEHMDDV